MFTWPFRLESKSRVLSMYKTRFFARIGHDFEESRVLSVLLNKVVKVVKIVKVVFYNRPFSTYENET